MGRAYSDFKQLLGGGVRSSGYEIVLPIDLIKIGLSGIGAILQNVGLSGFGELISKIGDSPQHSILIKSTSTPGLQQEVIPVKWHGNTFKLSGAVEYNDWEATHYLTPDSLLYDFYHAWFYISTFYNINNGQGIYMHPNWYNYPFLVFTKDASGSINGGWLMVGFVSNISDMQLSSDSEDLLEYNITYSINRQIRIPGFLLSNAKSVAGVLSGDTFTALFDWAGKQLGVDFGRTPQSTGIGATGVATNV